MSCRVLPAVASLALLAASPGLAQVAAMADAELNLRSGPGSSFEVVGVLPAQGEVSVTGCMTDTAWCQVDYQGTTAWAFGDYLSARVDDAPTVVIANREALGIGVATYEGDGTSDAEAAIGGGATTALAAAALIGGPAAIAAAAALGAGTAAALNPDDPAVAFVRDNPLDPVILEGEVVVGAGIPAEVALAPIPESEFDYAYVNGQPVVVERANRQIVYVVR